ncbi:MAG: PDZ domain-containing protein [Planctomycetota bacterium]|nr:MAG: PDZ domain-containing protein [Planctomycetota bacterium]REK26731.1 MAG: PDZ domain-containing protein [Planctomycetota bacterium]REK35608.1 MAG: PDZ domain-containing protein [Planctomycetota bacterium]
MKFASLSALAALALFSAGHVRAQEIEVEASAPDAPNVEDAVDEAAEAGPELEAEGDIEADADNDADAPRTNARDADENAEADLDSEEVIDERTDLNLGARLEADDDGHLRVGTLEDSGLAAEAGLREGDVITSIDGEDIRTQRELNTYLQTHQGRRVPITVLRDGEEQQLFFDTRTQAQAGTESDPANRAALGVSLRAMDDGIGIGSVTPGSPAARAGLRSGDRIVSLNGQTFTSVDPFIDAVGRVALDDDSEIVYVRDGEEMTTTFRPVRWNDVYVADSGDRNDARQTLRPDLDDATPAPRTYHDDYYYNPNRRSGTNGRYYQPRRFSYEYDDDFECEDYLEDRFDD